jgi:Protein of unknown function (DUF3761)
MKAMIRMMVVAAGLLVTIGLMAQAPAGAPAGATGMCKDGTYWTNASKQGACRGHQGVKDWYAAADASGAKTAAPAAAAAPVVAAKPAPAAPAAAAAPATSSKSPKPTSTASSGTPAPGGGPGMVWVNTDSKVYHCPGTKYYGTTKQGKYMTEADAKASGARPDHGNACGK